MSRPDRRDPQRQQPLVDGERLSDPTLSTRDCADYLGVSTDFVVGEIQDGRLVAKVLERPGLRKIYRVSRTELDAYVVRYGWKPAKGAAV